MEKLPRRILYDDKLLAKFTVFAELGGDELHTLLEQSAVETYSEGEIIIHSGEVGHCMYVILRGSVRVTVPIRDKSSWLGFPSAIFLAKLRSSTTARARQTSSPPTFASCSASPGPRSGSWLGFIPTPPFNCLRPSAGAWWRD